MTAAGGFLLLAGMIAFFISLVGLVKPMFFKKRVLATLGLAASIITAIVGGSLIDSGPTSHVAVADTPNLVREWGNNKPASKVMEALPPMVRVCWGLHFGALTEAERGQSDPLLPADLRDTCARSVPKLDGACRAYAEAASRLGQTFIDTPTGSPQRSIAERSAEEAFRRCTLAKQGY